MPRFKIAILPAVGALVLGALSGTALARRRHPPRPAVPAADAAPATEVDTDPAAHGVAPAPAADTAAAPATTTVTANTTGAEKTAGDAAPPVTERAPAPRHPAVTRDPPEAATAREGPSPYDASAGRLTGHVGVGSPLVTVRASRSTRHVGSVNEDFTLVAPLGLGMLLTDHWTFDFEFQISTGVRPEGLTTAIVDPGVIYAWERLAAGLRVAWQLNQNQNIGLIPLVRIIALRNARASWFIEASLPSFVQNKQITASASLQTGVGF